MYDIHTYPRGGIGLSRIDSIVPWDMVKTGANGWNAGAASNETILSGYVQAVCGPSNVDRMIGLSYIDNGQGFATIDYAIHASGSGEFLIWELGVNKYGPPGAETYAPGDVVRVQLSGTTVTYWRQVGGLGDFELIYTSLVPASGSPMLVDTAVFQTGTGWTDIRLVSGSKEIEMTWQNIVGVTVSKV